MTCLKKKLILASKIDSLDKISGNYAKASDDLLKKQ